jgi:hypothetical protein
MDAKVMLLSAVPLSPIHASLPAPTVKPIAELTASLPAATIANYNGNWVYFTFTLVEYVILIEPFLST